jgi:hypothetical protein
MEGRKKGSRSAAHAQQKTAPGSHTRGAGHYSVYPYRGRFATAISVFSGRTLRWREPIAIRAGALRLRSIVTPPSAVYV